MEEKVTAKINRKGENDFDLELSFKGLKYDNLCLIEQIFRKFIEKAEAGVSHMTEKEREAEHYSYRIYPTKEIKKALFDAMEKAVE